MKNKKLVSWVLIFLLVLQLFLFLWGTFKLINISMSHPPMEFSPYGYVCRNGEVSRGGRLVDILVGYIADSDSGVKYSFYPYSHYNADVILLPVDKDDSGLFKIGIVRYQFRLVEDALKITATEFYSREHWRELYEKNGSLYERRVDGVWPFDGRRMICPLSSEVGFYDPIRITGLGCGLLLLSAEDPGFESDIQVYVPTRTGWEKAKAVLPDGTELDTLTGYVRRMTDRSSRYAPGGYMELCMKDQDGQYLLYHVTYSDGSLLLTPDPTTEVTAEDLLCWAY